MHLSVPCEGRIENMAQKPNSIVHVEFHSNAPEKTKSFLKDVFGWKFEDYGPAYTSFFDGRLAGGFTTGQTTPAHGVLLVIYGSDLAALQKKIEAAGGKIVRDVFSFPGGRRFHFTDPNGNELAVWSDVE